MKNNKISLYSLKAIFIGMFLLIYVNTYCQPLAVPYPFEDYYLGGIDSVFALAKIKAHRIYYRQSNSLDKSLYREELLNKKGQILTQKWYNFISHKEMYVADYVYSDTGIIISSTEKITEYLDEFDFHSRKLDNQLYFVNTTPDNPMGEYIPNNTNGERIVKTKYSKDSLGNFFTKKYFYDGSFYKETIVSRLYEFGLYMDEKKIVDFYYSSKDFVADTINEENRLRISIKQKGNGKEYFKVLKKLYQNKFEISELDFVTDSIKIYFSTWGTGYHITYIDLSNIQQKLLLEHRFSAISFLDIKGKIALKEIDDIDRLRGMNGAYFYTKFTDGYLSEETQYSLEDGITKMQEKYYEAKYNLVSRIVAYSPHYPFIFGPFATSFRGYNQPFIEEIHEYEYYD